MSYSKSQLVTVCLLVGLVTFIGGTLLAGYWWWWSSYISSNTSSVTSPSVIECYACLNSACQSRNGSIPLVWCDAGQHGGCEHYHAEYYTLDTGWNLVKRRVAYLACRNTSSSNPNLYDLDRMRGQLTEVFNDKDFTAGIRHGGHCRTSGSGIYCVCWESRCNDDVTL